MPSTLIRTTLGAAALFLLGLLGGIFLSNSNRSLDPEDTTLDSNAGILERVIVQSGLPRQSRPQQTRELTSFREVLSQPTGFQQYLAAYNLAENSSVADLKVLIEDVLDHEDRFFRYGMATIFIEKFVEHDPDLALDFVLNNIAKGYNLYSQLLAVVFREWGRIDVNAAIEALTLVTNPTLKQFLLIQMLDDDLINNTSAAQLLTDDLLPQQRSQLALRRINRITPQAAFEEALSMRLNERQRATYTAVNRWVITDPEAALATINQLTDNAEKIRLMNYAIARWASNDPTAAALVAPGYDRGDGALIGTAIAAVSRYDHSTALELAEQYRNESFYNSLLTKVVSGWSQVDPAAAIAYLDSSGIESPNIIRTVAANYAQKFPLEAMAWAETLGDQAEMVRLQISQYYVSMDPDGAERYLSELSAGPLRDILISQLASEKARVNGRDALAWLSQYQNEPKFNQARTQIIHNWISQDASGAAEYIEDLISEGDKSASQLSESLVNSWLHQDVQATQAWINNLDDSAIKDSALSRFALNRAESNPDDALDLLDTITSNSTYSNVALNIAGIIVRRQPDRFDEIVTRLNLSAQQIEELRRMVDSATRN